MTTYESSRRTVGKMFLIFFLRHSQDSEQVRSWFPWTRAHVSESRRVGSVRNLLFPIPGGRLYVRRNTEGRGAGLNTCCATETPLTWWTRVWTGTTWAHCDQRLCLSPGANLSTGQLPDTHNTRDKDSHLLALTWCQMGWRPTAEPRNQEEEGAFFFSSFQWVQTQGNPSKSIRNPPKLRKRWNLAQLSTWKQRAAFKRCPLNFWRARNGDTSKRPNECMTNTETEP